MELSNFDPGTETSDVKANLYFHRFELQNNKLVVRPVSAEEVNEAYQLEVASYPLDEAATLEKLTFRQQVAGDFFLGMFSEMNGKMVGFVCGTCSLKSTLTEQAMSTHDPAGTSLCIHSIVVQDDFRRQGYATVLLKTCIDVVSTQFHNIQRILLIAKGYLLRFYVKCGFTLVGLSEVVHGEDPWFEMKVETKEARALPFMQVSAFAQKPFKGNPAAVFFQHGSEEWMQQVAAEMNLSETAFVQQLQDGAWHLRWFTPVAEVELCGHATLAAAHALWETERVLSAEAIKFSTLSGELTARKVCGWIQLDFPMEVAEPCGMPDGLKESFLLSETDVLYCGKNRMDFIMELSPEAFKTLTVDFEQLAKIQTRGVIVTCKSDQDCVNWDFESRCFYPRFGINEDPVTGSAHCCLGPYWSNKLGKAELTGVQKSSREGTVRVETNKDTNRTLIQGHAITCFSGSFFHRNI